MLALEMLSAQLDWNCFSSTKRLVFVAFIAGRAISELRHDSGSR